MSVRCKYANSECCWDVAVMPFQNRCFQVQPMVPHHPALFQAHAVASFGISVPFWFLSLQKLHFHAVTWSLLFANCHFSPYYWYHNYFLSSRKHCADLDECLRLNNSSVGWVWQFLCTNLFLFYKSIMVSSTSHKEVFKSFSPLWRCMGESSFKQPIYQHSDSFHWCWCKTCREG